MANESMISLNVNLGSTKNVTEEFNALIKVLESKKIKLDVDTSSLQASLKLASSEIEKAYSKVKDTVKKTNEEISKPVKSNNSGISELENQITSAEKAISKFTETKNKQLNNILAGNNGTMVPNLTEYDTLITKMNELKNMKLDSTNVDTYTQNVKEVQTAYDELTTKIRQVSSTSKEMNSSVKMNSDITNKVRDYNTQLEVMRQKNADIVNNPIYQQIANDVNKLSQANQPLRQLSNETNTIDNNMKQLRNSMTQVGNMGNVFTKLGQSIKSAFSFMSASMVFYQLANQIREIPNAVKEVDTAFVELQKVSQVTADQFDVVINNAYKKGNELSATLTDYMGAMASINRGGYSSDADINSLSKLSIVMKNVSENMKDTDDNATALIATIKGFNGEVSDAEHYVNAYNNVSNNMSVTFDQLVSGVEKASAVLNIYGNSYNDVLSMITGGTEIFGGDSDRVANGLKSIAMNLAGIDEETKNFDVEYFAKMEDTLKEVAGIDITETNGDLKSTYEILDDLAEVYPTLEKNQQLYLTQLIGKKTQSTVLAAVLQNWESVEKAQQLAINSAGSYVDEQAKYYESIQGYTDRLTSAFQKLSVTTLDSGLVKQVLQLTTNFINLIDNAGGLVPVLASVVVSMTALKVISASQSLTFSGLVQGAKSLITSMFTVKTATDAATVSTLALSAAEKTLVVGAIVAGVMALGAGIHYVATSSERAAQKVLDLSEELSKIKESSKTLKGLADEFEKLSKKGELNSEESKRFYEVQNQIKELQPEIGGYFDENGNFLIRQVSSAQELLDIQKEILETKKEELKNAQEDVLDDNIKKYEKQKQLLEDIARYSELAAKGKKLSASEGMERSSLSNKITMNGGSVSDLDGTIKDIKSEMFEASNEIHDYLINSLTLDDAWDSLGESMKNGIRKTLSEMDAEEINSFSQNIKNGSLSISDFIGEMSKISTPVETTVSALGDVSDISSETGESVKSLSERASESANKLDILKVALDELKNIQDISGSTLDKLIKKYPELEDELTSVSNATEVLNKKILEQNFDEATNKIADLTTILQDLENGNGITSSSFKKISENFPELLGYMNDEKSLIEAITDKTKDYKDEQNQAYKEMLMNSEEYYNKNILANEQMSNSILNNTKQLFNNLGVAYNDDLSNWKSLAQGKATVEEQLINQLNNAWETHFGNLRTAFAKTASGSIVEKATFDRDSFAKQNLLMDNNFSSDKGIVDMAEKAFYEQEAEWTSEQIKRQKAMNEIANLFNDIKFDAVDIKVGGGSKSSGGSKSDAKYAEYIDSIYDSILNSLQEGTDKIDRQIAISQSKIENLELFGNQEDVTKSTSDLEKLYQDRIDIMKKSSEQMVSLRNKMAKELQATGYEEIKGLDLTNISQLGVDKIINKLEKQIDAANKANDNKLAASLTYKKNLIEDYTGNIINANSEINSMAKDIMDAQNELADTVIDNIKRITELDKQRHDGKLKQIEIEQMLLDEDSDEYKAKEQDKINMLIELQKGYQESIRQLRAEGLTNESEEIREYISMWQDAEIERLNLIKARWEAEKEAQLKASQDKVDTLEKQKDAIEELTDLALSMIKKEAEAKKKAIQDEIDGYKAIIDIRKESLQKEQSDKKYQDGLIEKEKAIKSLEDELLALSSDNSEKANFQKLKLEEELQDARKELEEYQYDNSIEMREDALDEELEAFEKEKQEEIDVIDDMLSKEGTLRKQALAMIEKGNKELYDKLIEYNNTYGDGVETTITDAWSIAQEAMSEYGGTQDSLLTTLQNITLEMERQAQLQSQISNSTWGDYVKDNDITSNTTPNTGGSSGGTSSNNNTQGNNGLSEKGKEQLNQQKYLHDQMMIAKETSNKQLEAWIKAERKKWDLDPETGRILKQRHDGILSGRLDGLKPSELILRATEKEWVLTNPQMTNIENNFKNLQSNKSQQPSQPIHLTFDKLINVEGNLDKSVDIKSITKHVTTELVNTLALAGLVPKRK